MDRILNYKPVYDSKGNVIYEEKNKVKLESDPLKFCLSYLDDIICSTKLYKTYEETVKNHFACLEKIVERLNFHNVKLSINKSEFCKNKILFLGWIISHDFVIPDPRRLEKMKNAEFPSSKKEMRAFLGLVNSIRRVIPFNVINQMQILTPLTSSSKQAHYLPTEKHKIAFDKIKQLLLKEPLFANLIRPCSTKYIFVDASTATGSLGAVLLQRIDGCEGEKVLPPCLDLDDATHRYVYDHELPYQPAILYQDLPFKVPTPTALKTMPPLVRVKDKTLGYRPENLADSLYWSTVSVLGIYGAQIKDSILEYRKIVVQEIKKGILGIQLKDYCFNNNHSEYKQFLQEYELGQHYPDKSNIILRALAQGIRRTFILISNSETHPEKQCTKINSKCEKSMPPIILGVYEVNGQPVYLPFFYNKNLEFSIDAIKGKVEIVAYLAKSCGEQFKSHAILDLESFAILTALSSFNRYISGTKTILLTDSKVLYYMFNKRIGDSSVKIRRWVLKLIGDYPLLTLHFVRTGHNLADYLSRQGMPKGDLEKLNLKNIKIEDFFDKLPDKDFTLKEWENFCTANPQYLTVNNSPTIYQITKSINKGIDNLKEVSSPIEILKEKFSRAKLISEQKKEYSEIYQQCLGSEDFTYASKDKKGRETIYKLVLDLLMIKPHNCEEFKIYIPHELLGVLLAYVHLLGHLGTGRMMKNLETYYYPALYTIVRKFASRCYGCFLMHSSSRKQLLGTYPIPEYPFEEVSLDLIENLNKSGGCQHILVCKCALTDFTLLFPMKSKTSSEVAKMLKAGLLQQYRVLRLHTDNGACFREKAFLSLLTELKIEVINTSSRNPAARGFVEAEVQIIKSLMKKILAGSHHKTLNWEDLPLIISIMLNHIKSPRTGYSPATMLYGENNPMSGSFLDLENFTVKPHLLVRNNKPQLYRIGTAIKEISALAKETITANRDKFHDIANENRINKTFQKFDVVFTLDRTQIPGAPRPLRTKFSPSPFFVVKVFHSTLLIQRMSDNFRTLISMNHVKKYSGTDSEFTHLPDEIKNILINDFRDLHPHDFDTILRIDPLHIPEGIELAENNDESDEEDNHDESNTPNSSQIQEYNSSKNKGKGKRKPTVNDERNDDPLPSTSQDRTAPKGETKRESNSKNLQGLDHQESSDEEEAVLLRGEKRVHFDP